MLKYNDITVMKAISICFKPFLKPEEAMIYCNLGIHSSQKNAKNMGSIKMQTAIINAITSI